MSTPLIVSLGVLFTVLSGNALAETTRRPSVDNGALLRAQQLTQELTEKNSVLEQEKAALLEQLTAHKARLQAVEATRGAAENALTEYKNHSAVLTERLQQSIQKSRTLQSERQELRETLKDAERTQERTRLEQEQWQLSLKQQQDETAACEAKNVNLYRLNLQLLENYRDKGVWDALLQAEPATGIKGVEVDNLLQEYHDKLEQNRVRTQSP